MTQLLDSSNYLTLCPAFFIYELDHMFPPDMEKL